MSPAKPDMKTYPLIEHHPSEPRWLQFVGTSQTVAMCMDEDAAKKLVEAWNANASLAPEPRVAREWVVAAGGFSGLCVKDGPLLPRGETVRVREVLPEQEEPQSIWLKGYGKPFRITRDKQEEPVAPAPERVPEFRYFKIDGGSTRWRLSDRGKWQMLRESGEWIENSVIIETDAAGVPLEGGGR